MLKLVLAPDLRKIIDVGIFIIGVHKDNSKSMERDYTLCQRFAQLSETIVKLTPFAYVSLGILYQLPSIFKCHHIKNCEPSMGVYLPGMSYLENYGLALQAFHNIVISLLDILIFTAFEMLIYIVFTNMLLISTIIVRELGDLRMALEKPDTSEYEIQCRLLKIIQMHKKYNEYWFEICNSVS